MGIRKHLTKAAALSLTAGIVTIGGLGFAGVASADEGSGGRQMQRPAAARPAAAPASTTSFRADLTSIAAQKLGISVDTLRRDMAQGRSIKQIAAQRGVVYSDLKTSLVNAEGAALQDATAKGTVTQTQANLLVSNIPQQVESFLTAGARTVTNAGGSQNSQRPGQGPTQQRPGQGAPQGQAGPGTANRMPMGR